MSPRAAWWLEALGFDRVYDYVGGKADWLASGLPFEGELANLPRVGELARDVPTCAPDEQVAGAARRAAAVSREWCAVVVDDRVVVGTVDGDAWEDGDAAVRDAMQPGPLTFRPDVPAGVAAHFLDEHERDGALVTTSDGRLVGYVSIEDAALASGHSHGAHEDDQDGGGGYPEGGGDA